MSTATGSGITLPTDELPDWARNGKLGIDLLWDDNTYTEMFGALRKAEALQDRPAEGRLIRILTGQEHPFNYGELRPN